GVVKISFLNKVFVETPEFTTLVYLKDFDKEFSYIGSKILVLGKTKHIYHYLTNKNMYGYFIYLFSNNIPFVVYTDEEKIGEISGTESLFFSLVNNVRQNIYDTFSKYIVHTSWVSMSLIMGESSEMSKEFRENVRISGISHIFSVSGFHVGVIVFALISLLSVFKLSKSFQFLVVSVFLVIYCFIVGLKPPVVRSSILASVILLVRSLGTSPNYLNISLLTGIVMLIVNPFLSVDVGFILSFLAVISIILFSGYISDIIVSFFNKYNVEPSYFLNSLIILFSVSLVSVLFTLPVVVLWFGSSSITGVVSSMVLVPLSSLNIVGGIMGYFLSLIMPYIGEYVFRTVNFLNLVFVIITELFSKLGFIVKFNLGDVFYYLVFFLVYYSLVVFLFLIVSRRIRISI
ncbi:MAG: ComEC/Rec2 family competence protein, partial [Brevinematia bacterium]